MIKNIQKLHPHSPKDMGTALASTIGMIFTMSFAFSTCHSDKLILQQLKQSQWNIIEIKKEDHLDLDFLEFRTGDITMFIQQAGNDIYEQPCQNFKQLCLDLQKK